MEGLDRLSSINLEYELQIAVLGWKSTIKQLCHAAEHPTAGFPFPSSHPYLLVHATKATPLASGHNLLP